MKSNRRSKLLTSYAFLEKRGNSKLANLPRGHFLYPEKAAGMCEEYQRIFRHFGLIWIDLRLIHQSFIKYS